MDFSANPPSISSAHLLATIPVNRLRAGFIIMNVDGSNEAYAVFDDGASGVQTIIPLDPASSAGGEGGSVSMPGMPHSGRILIYGATTGTAVVAREW